MVGKRILTKSQCAVSLFIITSGSLFFIENTALISYWYTLLLFFLVNHFLDPKYKFSNYCILHFYLFIAVSIYCIQLYNIPDYLGLSGPEGGIGTDDIRYFEKIVDVPIKCTSTATWIESYSFSDFLDFIYPFTVYSPLNIVLLNLLGISFLPYFTSKFAEALRLDTSVVKLSGALVLFCPFVMSNGLIILRDIWTATLVVAGLYFLLAKQYFVLLLSILLIAYLRFGSILFLILGLLILFKEKIYGLFATKRQAFAICLLILLSCIICFKILFPFLILLSDGKLESSLFRESFVEVLAEQDEGATIVKLAQLPIWVRVPLLSLFFFFAPFLKFTCYTEGVFNIRTVMSGIISPVYLFFCWKYIIKSFFIGCIKKTEALTIIQIVLLFALALGTISLQIRHKTVIMPFLYILVAYGYHLPKSKNDRLFTFIATLIFIFEFFYALR